MVIATSTSRPAKASTSNALFRESDPKCRERQSIKRAIYAKRGLKLIELGDSELERLDDVLPRMLLRFGIENV